MIRRVLILAALGHGRRLTPDIRVDYEYIPCTAAHQPPSNYRSN